MDLFEKEPMNEKLQSIIDGRKSSCSFSRWRRMISALSTEKRGIININADLGFGWYYYTFDSHWIFNTRPNSENYLPSISSPSPLHPKTVYLLIEPCGNEAIYISFESLSLNFSTQCSLSNQSEGKRQDIFARIFLLFFKSQFSASFQLFLPLQS